MMTRLLFIATAIVFLTSSCRTGHHLFTLDEIQGYWSDQPTGTTENTTADTPVELMGVRFSTGDDQGVSTSSNNRLGCNKDDVIFRNLSPDGDENLSGEMRVKKADCNRAQWVPATLTRVSEDKLEVHADCQDCGFETTKLLYRQ